MCIEKIAGPRWVTDDEDDYGDERVGGLVIHCKDGKDFWETLSAA